MNRSDENKDRKYLIDWTLDEDLKTLIIIQLTAYSE